jgi:hypothetical protein
VAIQQFLDCFPRREAGVAMMGSLSNVMVGLDPAIHFSASTRAATRHLCQDRLDCLCAIQRQIANSEKMQKLDTATIVDKWSKLACRSVT